MNAGQTTVRGTLQRIADALGYPMGAFIETCRENRCPDEAAELLRLWMTIEDPDVRGRILAVVQSRAEARVEI